MRIVLEEYLKSMKEKDELDFLLCDLLMLDGYIVYGKPQKGERQYGVDIHARKEDKIYLFVIKQQNITRSTWDSVPNGVRASFNEILDCYINNNIIWNGNEKEIHIVLVTNGIIDDSVMNNLAGFINSSKQAKGIPLYFDILNISALVNLCERVAFNEALFPSAVQSLLRKALYYIDEPNFTNIYFERVVDYYINRFKELGESKKELKKILTSYNACVSMMNQWMHRAEQYKKSIDLIEYCLISFWRYAFMAEKQDDNEIKKYMCRLLDLYEENNSLFFNEVKQICDIDNGLRSVNVIENRFLTLDIASRISLWGLYELSKKKKDNQIAIEIYDVLARLLNNNQAYKYPLYDDNIIELSFIYLFIKEMDFSGSKIFLQNLILGIYENFHINKVIPSPSDDYEEVLSIYLQGYTPLYEASILFGTLLEWTCCSGLEDLFNEILFIIKSKFSKMSCQTWQISLQEEADFFLHGASFHIGTGFPFHSFENVAEFRKMLVALDAHVDFNHFKSNSQSAPPAILLIASRYFHCPVLPQFWRGGNR